MKVEIKLWIFFQFCLTNEVDYLTIRVYIGVWLGIIGLVVACFEGSVLVKLFTRFTEEIFAALISILFIVESIMKLYMVSVIVWDFRI
jgi:solute carrier family 4 anion exchanger 2